MWPWIALGALLGAWVTALVLVRRADLRARVAVNLVSKKEVERMRLEQEVHWYRLQYPNRDWYRETRKTVFWPRPKH